MIWRAVVLPLWILKCARSTKSQHKRLRLDLFAGVACRYVACNSAIRDEKLNVFEPKRIGRSEVSSHVVLACWHTELVRVRREKTHLEYQTMVCTE